MALNFWCFGFNQYANYIHSAPSTVDNNINITMMLKNVDISFIPPPNCLISFVNPLTKYLIWSGTKALIHFSTIIFLSDWPKANTPKIECTWLNLVIVSYLMKHILTVRLRCNISNLKKQKWFDSTLVEGNLTLLSDLTLLTSANISVLKFFYWKFFIRI